jgi:hypothetical protein
VPSGVKGALTAGAGKSLTLQVKADDGAKVCGRQTWLIGFRNHAWRVPELGTSAMAVSRLPVLALSTRSQSVPIRSRESTRAVSEPEPQRRVSLPAPPLRRSLPGEHRPAHGHRSAAFLTHAL